MIRHSLVVAAAAGLLVLGGCATYKRDESLVLKMKQGDYGRVRESLRVQRTRNTNNRDFVLDRMKQVIVSMADGAPQSSEGTVDYLYDWLRTQGLNADKTVSAFIGTEMGARIWKGEPFEQAMAYSYIAMFDGMDGDWGNVRASADNSLFLLRDFSDVLHKARANDAANKASAGNQQEWKSSDPEVQQAMNDRRLLVEESSRVKKDADATKPDDLGLPYATTDSDFELGYILKAIACRQLNLPELSETTEKLASVAPHLAGFAEQIRSGQYNTVLVVDYGTGPEKYHTGLDNVIALFRPTMPPLAQGTQLSVKVGSQHQSFPLATNLDRLATDLKWNNLEDMRKAKSYIGIGMQIAGTGVALHGASNRNTGEALAGLAILAVGTALRASAAADIRHCEFLPQATFVALLNLNSREPVEIAVDGVPQSRVEITTLTPPPANECQLRYVRLPVMSQEWATNGQIRYSNDLTGEIAGDQLPYILGGRCVRMPTPEVLSAYQRSGHLAGMTYNDLMDLYREEGIVIADVATDEGFGLHVLEGGNWMFTPMSGSTGSLRLYGQDHPPYVPKSEHVKAIVQQLQQGATAHAMANLSTRN